MWYLLKPIGMSLRYKWTLLGSIFVALIIGILWGASITTVYPFVEVIFEGKSAETWIDQQIEKAQSKVTVLDEEIAQLEEQIGVLGQKQAPAHLTVTLNIKSSQRDLSQRSVQFYSVAKQRFIGLIPQTPFGTLVFLMGLLVVATVVKGICRVLSVIMVARIANRTTMDLRRIFYRKALYLDQKKIDQMGATQLMTQLIHNLNLVNAGLKNLYGQSVREPLKMGACLIVAAFISWKLLVLSLLVAPLGGLAIHFLAGRMKRAAKSEMGGVAGALQTLMETFTGLKIVRIFNAERRERRRFRGNAQVLYRLSMKITFYDSLIRPITELVGILALVTAILAGAYLVLNQETHLLGIRISQDPLSPSALFVFFGMLAGISDPARKMGDIYNSLVRAEMASQNLYTSFGEKQELVAEEPVATVPTNWKKIRLVDTCFAYHLMQRVLGPIDLEIPFGQSVAFVGSNGCGKTTLVNLIVRFFDPTKGAILFDDVNLKNLKPSKIRRQFAMVTQDPVLFRGTIWENILYGKPNATKEQVLQAASITQVDEFVTGTPEGYQKQIGDQGKFLSGGQRQRIALARAVLADPRIIILDEATSQLDQHTEERVLESMREFLSQRTTLLISHRLSTLSVADRVIVMDSGKVLADVTAQEYLNQNSYLLVKQPKAA